MAAPPTCGRWDAQMLVLDNRPFPDLRQIVRDAADERIRVIAEWVSVRAGGRPLSPSCPEPLLHALHRRRHHSTVADTPASGKQGETCGALHHTARACRTLPVLR